MGISKPTQQKHRKLQYDHGLNHKINIDGMIPHYQWFTTVKGLQLHWLHWPCLAVSSSLAKGEVNRWTKKSPAFLNQWPVFKHGWKLLTFHEGFNGKIIKSNEHVDDDWGVPPMTRDLPPWCHIWKFEITQVVKRASWKARGITFYTLWVYKLWLFHLFLEERAGKPCNACYRALNCTAPIFPGLPGA